MTTKSSEVITPEVMNPSGRNFAQEFILSWAEGVRVAIIRSSQILCEAIDEDPKWMDIIKEKCGKMLPPSLFSDLEKIGRGMLHVDLYLGFNTPNYGKIKQLPPSLQERVIKGEKFEFLLSNGDKMLQSPLDLTSDQCQQLIGGKNIRTLAQQKSWMEEKKFEMSNRTENAVRIPYVIIKGKLVIPPNGHAVEFTTRDLKTIMKSMMKHPKG